MKYKYGNFSKNQMHSYKDMLHSRVHWLLIYKENGYEQLELYISNLQLQLAGLAELIDSPSIIQLATLVECALLEIKNPEFNHKKYRKIVLDAHSVIDTLPEGDLDE